MTPHLPPARAALHALHADWRSPAAAGMSTYALNFQGLLYALIVHVCLYVIARGYHVEFDAPYRTLGLLACMLSFVGLRSFNLTTPWAFGRPHSEGNRLMLHWASIVGILLLIGYATKWSAYFSRTVLLLWFVATPASLLLLNSGVQWLTRRALPDLAPGRKAVMIFANDTARKFADNVRRSHSFDVVGLFEDRGMERIGGAIDAVPFLGPTERAADYIREHDVAVVFIFLSVSDCDRVRELLEVLNDTTASVYYVPDFDVFDRIDTRLISVESVPMLEVVETPFYGVDGLMKQIFDSSAALIALTMLAIPLAIIALLVKLGSPGPVFFRQKRYGLNGREFWIYKFRSMAIDCADADTRQATRDDARITPLGRVLRRTSMDELPQLFNVLKGDMSLVGPRPHTIAHNEYYRKAVRRYMVRHKVKPGLTGLAQVNGYRGETPTLELMEGRVHYDLEYIRNWSLWLDLKILLRTVVVVLRGDDNAY